MISYKGFPFMEYQPYFQQIVDSENTLRLQEPTYFDHIVKSHLGLEVARSYTKPINVWFDIKMDILWTLTEDSQTLLVSVLEDIQKKWAERKKE